MLLAALFCVIVTLILGGIFSAAYNIFLHPLRHIPGPKSYAASRLPYINLLFRGTVVKELTALHRRYGHAVRFSPNEVSFTSGETAWPDIYGPRPGSILPHKTFPKDMAWFPKPVNGAPSILVSDDRDHARGRKLLSHAFTDKAVAEQEPILQNYADQLVQGIGNAGVTNRQLVDLVRWYNWTTFDIVSDLLFGESFGCLQQQETHQYVDLLLDSLKFYRTHYLSVYFPWSKPFHRFLFDLKIIKSRPQFGAWVREKCELRCNMERQRVDIMSLVMEHNEHKRGLSMDEVISNAQLMLSAGSETSATLLSGLTYLLLTHQECYKRLKDEIRSTFISQDAITLESLRHLPYLNAVISEGLRYFPPVPTGFQRRVPQGGAVVSGMFLPAGTALCVSSYPAAHLESNFRDADTFIPERWLDDPQYKDDARASCQPFSFGPRACLGKNLANNEMRLILAKVVLNYDFELDDSSGGWLDRCLVMMTWIKPRLLVRVKSEASTYA